MLERAIRQIKNDFGVRSAFFVEDTSLRIDALSGPIDFPGVAVKEWFKEITFEQLDCELKERNDNRRVTVKSDIALNIPSLDRPIFFHGETSGIVARQPPAFLLNRTYPWLTPHNFNGWFIPDGERLRLGELEPERSLDVDFRAKSLGLLLDRLYEFNGVSQLERTAFYVRQGQQLGQSELPLGFQGRNVFVVIGHRCAGKTTFGDFARTELGALHLEASHLIRHLAMRDGESVETSSEAKTYLSKHGQDAVAREMVHILELRSSEPVVITGIRTLEELEFLLASIPDLQVIALQADLKTRFFRHLKRGRDQAVHTMAEFAQSDEEQCTFGLLRVMEDVASTLMQNDSISLDAFLDRVRTCVASPAKASLKGATAIEPFSMQSELVRTLTALEELGHAATCEEISAVTSELGAAVRKYNTNRALKAVPELATRIQERNQLLMYDITTHGRTLLRVMRLTHRLPTWDETLF